FPSGCPFHPRCPYRVAICAARDPQLELVGDRSVACWVAQERGSLPDGAEAGDRRGTSDRASPAAATATTGQKQATDEILVLDNITCHHLIPNRWPLLPPTRVHALDDVSLTIQRGEVLGVAGESGCGKSTLARCILRLTDVDSGCVVFRGQDITRLGGEELRQIRRYMQP